MSLLFVNNVLPLPEEKRNVRIDRKKALEDLLSRCPECLNRFESVEHI